MNHTPKFCSLRLAAVLLLSALMLCGCDKKKDDDSPKETTAISETDVSETKTETTDALPAEGTAIPNETDTSTTPGSTDSVEIVTEEGELFIPYTTPQHTEAQTIPGSDSEQTNASVQSETTSASTSTTNSSGESGGNGDIVELPFVPFQ